MSEQEKQTKTTLVQLKQAGDAGSFEAVIATFDEVDQDGDVIEPGAFDGATVPVLPAHDSRSVPLGKATVEERGEKAVAVGRFNLDVAAARDWHAAVKFDLEHPPSRQEWSWGFVPTKFRFEERDDAQVRVIERVDLLEVSPVLRGASVGTATIAAKERKADVGEAGGEDKRATAPHESATDGDAWSAATNERRLPSPVPIGEARKAYAWIEDEAADGEEVAKSAGRFIHHFVGGGGRVGAASTRACVAGIGVLNGARGGTTIPAADRQGVWDHLAKHLRDADLEPPELRSAEDVEAGDNPVLNEGDGDGEAKGEDRPTAAEACRAAAGAVRGAIEAVQGHAAMREGRGRAPSDEAASAAVDLAAELEPLKALAERLAEFADGVAEARGDGDATERALGRLEYIRARFPSVRW